MGELVASLLIGGFLGFLAGLYFDTKQAVALRDQTKEILLTIGNAFNSLKAGEDFEVRVTAEGKATVVKFARTRSGALQLEGHEPSVKID